MAAFEKWFIENYQNDLDGGANHLFKLCIMGAPESAAWKWVQKVGGSIDAFTFYKAAQLIVKSGGEDDGTGTKSTT
jgi:hypothetical protein